MECVEPRRKNSPLDYFCLSFGLTLLAQNLAPSFSIPLISTSSRYKKTVLCTAFWWFEVECVEPRRKNSPLDYFCLSFGLTLLAQNLATSFSIPLISTSSKHKKTVLCTAFWWFEVESNHRHEDFQSSALPTELSNHINFSLIKKWRPGTGSNRRPLA